MIGLNLKRSLPFLIRESFILEEEESHQRTKTPSGEHGEGSRERLKGVGGNDFRVLL